jgi:hypothetical protein
MKIEDILKENKNNDQGLGIGDSGNNTSWMNYMNNGIPVTPFCPTAYSPVSSFGYPMTLNQRIFVEMTDANKNIPGLVPVMVFDDEYYKVGDTLHITINGDKIKACNAGPNSIIQLTTIYQLENEFSILIRFVQPEYIVGVAIVNGYSAEITFNIKDVVSGAIKIEQMKVPETKKSVL